MKKKKPNPELVDDGVKKIVDGHLDHINEIVLSILAQALSSELNYYDVNYISKRTIQVIEDTLPDINFKFPALEEKINAYLKEKAIELTSKAKISVFESGSREAKCEPIVHSMVSMISSLDFLEKDKEWLDSYIEESNRMFVVNLIKHLFEATFSKLDFALEQSHAKAQDKLFGVEKARLPLKRLDEVLKY